MAVMRISSTAAAGNISGSRVGEGIVASFLLLVRALAVPSSAEECYSRIPTNFDMGPLSFLPRYPTWFSDFSRNSGSYSFTFLYMVFLPE